MTLRPPTSPTPPAHPGQMLHSIGLKCGQLLQLRASIQSVLWRLLLPQYESKPRRNSPQYPRWVILNISPSTMNKTNAWLVSWATRSQETVPAFTAVALFKSQGALIMPNMAKRLGLTFSRIQTWPTFQKSPPQFSRPTFTTMASTCGLTRLGRLGLLKTLLVASR